MVLDGSRNELTSVLTMKKSSARAVTVPSFWTVSKWELKVAYVPGVFIDEMPEPDSLKYKQYRYRACGPSRKCFEKRGIEDGMCLGMA